jgi:hypothetical protein
MLLGWGFTQPAKAGDWLMAVQLHYGVLPLLPWQAAVQAAAAVATRHQHKHQQQQDSEAAGQQVQQEPDAAVFARLACVAANLPLALPESIWDGGRGGQLAAAAFKRQVSSAGVKHQQQVYQPLHGSMLQKEKVEALFARDLAAAIAQQQQQQQAGAAQGAAAGLSAGQQQQQHQKRQQCVALTAGLLQRCCFGQLAACRSTTQEDAQLLQQLQGQQPQQQQEYTTQRLMLLLQQSQEPGAASERLLQQFDEVEQQLLQTLALVAAYSNLRSMCDSTAESAQVVLTALQPQVQQLEQQLGLPSWQGRGGGRKQAAAAVAAHCCRDVGQLLLQQDALLQQLGLLAEQRLSSQASSDHLGCHSADGAAAGLPAGMNSDRLAAAVAARLEQKQLLAVGAELCQQLQLLLAADAC